MKNPINAQPQPIQGQPLPTNWRQQAKNTGGTYDRRDLENMWKEPRWTSKLNDDGAFTNIAQQTRLSGSSANKENIDRADSVRWDEVIGEK